MKNTSLLLALTLLLLPACETLGKPESPLAANNLTQQGYQLLEQQQPRPASAMFDQAIAADTKNIRAYQGKAIALGQLGSHAEADSVYEQALKLSPGSVAITNNYAMSKILQGEYEQAIDMLSPLAEATPNETVIENMALANCLLGKRDDAKKLYRKRISNKQIEENLSFCKAYEDRRKE